MTGRSYFRRFIQAGCVLLSLGATSAAASWSLGGVELNPVRVIDNSSPLAARSDSRTMTLSGGIHIVDDTGRREIALPLAWLSSQERDDASTEDLLLFRSDFQYRRFLAGSNHSGLFAGPLLRYAHVASHNRQDGADSGADRFGAGIVLGFRTNVNKDYWWGMTLAHGRFIGGIPDMNDDITFADPAGTGAATTDTFTELEVFTFGKRF